ncbi:DUF2894 domain-containing protein [Hydrogenophaga sp.]|uniref:DUF2894 domain-containing protein n=1 Tax=Hydrogenophaga sp. TaxID=1904254 RepID=UPI003D0A26E3
MSDARPERAGAPTQASANAAAPSPLVLLNRHISEITGIPPGTTPELRSARAFRETWSRIAAEDEVTEAVQRGPDNAGPLNSHMLVLRTLGLLRELSPDYLRRFLAHADTLLWLDQTGELLRQPSRKGKPGRQKK